MSGTPTSLLVSEHKEIRVLQTKNRLFSRIIHNKNKNSKYTPRLATRGGSKVHAVLKSAPAACIRLINNACFYSLAYTATVCMYGTE